MSPLLVSNDFPNLAPGNRKDLGDLFLGPSHSVKSSHYTHIFFRKLRRWIALSKHRVPHVLTMRSCVQMRGVNAFGVVAFVAYLATFRGFSIHHAVHCCVRLQVLSILSKSAVAIRRIARPFPTTRASLSEIAEKMAAYRAESCSCSASNERLRAMSTSFLLGGNTSWHKGILP